MPLLSTTDLESTLSPVLVSPYLGPGLDFISSTGESLPHSWIGFYLQCKRLFCRVEGEDAHWRLYRLPVVIGRAEPPEGDGIARAWIEDVKVYPGIPITQ